MMRRMKMDKNRAEELSCLCAVITNLSDELQAQYPISPEVVSKEILDAFIQGDANFEVEMKAVVFEKSEKLKLLDVERFREVVNTHARSADARLMDMGMNVGNDTIEFTAAGLEEKALTLDLQKLLLDVKVYKNYKTKVKDREANEYNTRLNWANERQKAARAFAEQFIKAVFEFCVCSGERKKDDQPVTRYVKFVKAFEEKLGNNATTAIPSSTRSVHSMHSTG